MRQPSWKTYRKIHKHIHCTLYMYVAFFMCVCVCELCRKVQMMEDSDGIIHLKNLSLHPAANEEEGERNERDVFVCDLSTAMCFIQL